MAADWAKMPAKWIRDLHLADFGAATPAIGAAALKIFISLCLKANFGSKEDMSGAGSVRLSYSELRSLTGASRKLIANGIDFLELVGRVEVERSGRANTYQLLGYADPAWVKLPKRHLLGRTHGMALGDFPLREDATFHALKVYLALGTFRNGTTGEILISSGKLGQYALLNKDELRRALSLLIFRGLIGVIGGHGVEREEARVQFVHRYVIVGLK